MIDDRTVAGLSALAMSSEHSPAKSLEKARWSEGEGFVNLNLQSDALVYSNPSFLKGVADSLLLPINQKWLSNIGRLPGITCMLLKC